MNEIINQITKLKNDDQIWSFIMKRITMLELNSKEKMLGKTIPIVLEIIFQERYILNQHFALKMVNV